MPNVVTRLVKKTPFLRGARQKAGFFWRARAVAAAWRDLPAAAPARVRPQVVVFGRYGQETVGNHFIQVGLLRALHQALPDRPVLLLSTDVDFTARGIAEMRQVLDQRREFIDFSRYIAAQVSVGTEDAIRSLGRDDLLVLGGGPLTDDPILVKWLLWFQWAKRAGARIMIAGCGLGPMYNRRSAALAESLIALTDVALVRNDPPATLQRVFGRLRLALDPAFLCHSFLAPRAGGKHRLLAINARALDFACTPRREVSPAVVARNVAAHGVALARWAKFDAVVPFSTHEAGAPPDSAVSVCAAAALARTLGIEALPPPPATVLGLVETFEKAEYMLSTRMHGFIVGLMLGCRAANLDYIWGGGKGDQLYRQWLGRPAAPSLFRPDSSGQEDYLSLSSLTGTQARIDDLNNQYAEAILDACA